MTSIWLSPVVCVSFSFFCLACASLDCAGMHAAVRELSHKTNGQTHSDTQ